MSAKREAPVVAELGRPETPQEAADRKAEASRAYRSSQTLRGLIAAMLATLAVVAVIVFAVPRGEPVPAPPVDVEAIAANVETTLQSPVLVPEIPEDWRVNSAELANRDVPVWEIIIAPSAQSERGFVRIAQAFGADRQWASVPLQGAGPRDTLTAGGLTWDVFRISDAEATANISYALGTQAGDDYVLLYGARTPDDMKDLATDLAPTIRSLTEE